MKINSKITSLFNKALLVCLIWFIMALVISSITFLNQLQGNYSQTLSPISVILFEVACIIPWVISTPLIVWVTGNYPLEKKVLRNSLPVHLLTALGVFIFHSVVQSYQVSLFYMEPLDWAYLKRDFLGFLDMRLMLYTGVVLGTYAIGFQRKNRESRMREPRLEAQLNKARYQALLNQIQPSFLLDSIDTIREKVRSNANESEHVLTDFSDLLRIMLQNTEREEVTIQEDLESYYLYVNLLEERLGTEIEKTSHVEEGCCDALVPSYRVLLPLIEEIISDVPQTAVNVSGISYSAKREYAEMYLALSIEGVELAPRSLAGYLEAIHFTDIRHHLESKYSGEIGIEIGMVEHSIKVNFRFPFKTQQADKKSFGEVYVPGNPESQSTNS